MPLQDCEVWTRILPTAEVLQMMEDLNVSPKRIVAVQGPFSYDMNCIMFHDTRSCCSYEKLWPCRWC